METETTPVANLPEMTTAGTTVTLSPMAADKLQKILAEKNLAGYGLRVFVAGGGCSGYQYGMAFENSTEEGDAVCESNGVRIFVDSASAMYLEGATVDYVDSLMGGGFRIENPNAVSTCSCGQSFSAEEGEHGSTCGCGHH